MVSPTNHFNKPIDKRNYRGKKVSLRRSRCTCFHSLPTGLSLWARTRALRTLPHDPDVWQRDILQQIGAGLRAGSVTPVQAVQIAIASGHGPGERASRLGDPVGDHDASGYARHRHREHRKPAPPESWA